MVSGEDPSDVVRESVRLLEDAIARFECKIGRPLSLEETGKRRLRYPRRDSLTFQVLRAVRVVSGLNAAICLLRNGYVQEVGVVLRSAYQFLHDIDFVTEAHRAGNPTVDQQKLIDTFFADDLQTAEERMADDRGTPRVPRKKVYASMGRLFETSDPDHVRKMAKAIEESFSGYTHGAYPQTMELYDPDTEKFRVRGMRGTPRIMEFARQLAFIVHLALNVFAWIAGSIGFNDLSDELIAQRKKVEDSPLY